MKNNIIHIGYVISGLIIIASILNYVFCYIYGIFGIIIIDLEFIYYLITKTQFVKIQNDKIQNDKIQNGKIQNGKIQDVKNQDGKNDKSNNTINTNKNDDNYSVSCDKDDNPNKKK